MLGDEGSGAAMGKNLVSDILKQQLPQPIIHLFFKTYHISPEEIMNTVYREPFPNRYLANYSKFLYANIHLTEIEEFVINNFNEFISRNLYQYDQASTSEIHFTGSIAYYFKDQLNKSLTSNHLKAGQITKAPMPGLIKYHLEN